MLLGGTQYREYRLTLGFEEARRRARSAGEFNSLWSAPLPLPPGGGGHRQRPRLEADQLRLLASSRDPMEFAVRL